MYTDCCFMWRATTVARFFFNQMCTKLMQTGNQGHMYVSLIFFWKMEASVSWNKTNETLRFSWWKLWTPWPIYSTLPSYCFCYYYASCDVCKWMGTLWPFKLDSLSSCDSYDISTFFYYHNQIRNTNRIINYYLGLDHEIMVCWASWFVLLNFWSD